TPTFLSTASTDPDGGPAGQIGVLTIDDNGNWAYSVDNDNPYVQGLDDGDTITEIYQVATADGADTQT
ncbi:hypothetical protein TW81_18755, partial [Vibrio galatheae]